MKIAKRLHERKFERQYFCVKESDVAPLLEVIYQTAGVYQIIYKADILVFRNKETEDEWAVWVTLRNDVTKEVLRKFACDGYAITRDKTWVKEIICLTKRA